jgi:hypothetical protein
LKRKSHGFPVLRDAADQAMMALEEATKRIHDTTNKLQAQGKE